MDALMKKYNDKPRFTRKDREQIVQDIDALDEMQAKSNYLHSKYINALEGVLTDKKEFYHNKQLDQQEQELYKQTFGGTRNNRIIIQRRSSCYRSGNAYWSLHFNSIYRLVGESSFTPSTKSLLSSTTKSHE